MDMGRTTQRFIDGRQSFEGRQFDRGQAQQFRTQRDRDMMRGSDERMQREAMRRDYQVRRPTDDQVRDFLQMRQDRDRDVGPQRDRDFDSDRDQFRQRAGERQQRDNQIVDRDRGERDARNRDFDNRNLTDRDLGDRDFTNRDFRDRDRDGDFRDGDFRDRDVNRWYDDWRRAAWADQRGRGRDFRDWSGRWRDGDRFDTAWRIRDRWRDRDWDDFPFRFGWWDQYRWYGPRWYHWGNFARNQPFYWWGWATAPRLTTWLTYGWPTPYYWDYGPGEYIYYDDGAIHVNGRWYQPAPVYYDNTVRLIEQAPELTAEEAAQVEWLPLGVFAVTEEGLDEANVLLQLAVTQDGLLGGTATDPGTGVIYAIEGTVDKQSQRAVWSYTTEDDKRVVMETSIFNLTQGAATALVHHGPNNMHVIELVRLESPTESAVASEGELPAPPQTR
jgi:hypothetical protein